MVTASQARANVASATTLLARQLGLYSNDGSGFDYSALSPNDQITLTNALAAYIQAHPALFDTGATDLTNPALSAAYSTNSGIEENNYALGQFVDTALSEARAINPLDSQNIGTVGKYLLGAAVILGAVYIVAKPGALASLKKLFARANPAK